MDLYDTDFFAWTQQQAEAVRAGVWDDIDRDHLAEEIADWWKRDSHLLWQHLRDLMGEETGLPLATFPETCPWTPEHVLTAPLEGPNSPFFGESS